MERLKRVAGIVRNIHSEIRFTTNARSMELSERRNQNLPNRRSEMPSMPMGSPAPTRPLMKSLTSFLHKSLDFLGLSGSCPKHGLKLTTIGWYDEKSDCPQCREEVNKSCK